MNYEQKLFNYFDEELGIFELSKKLESFYLLNDKQFLKEIKKKNKNVDEKYLLSLFHSSKKEIEILNKELKIKSFNLNQLVYEIYNLNNEEIKIIEENI